MFPLLFSQVIIYFLNYNIDNCQEKEDADEKSNKRILVWSSLSSHLSITQEELLTTPTTKMPFKFKIEETSLLFFLLYCIEVAWFALLLFNWQYIYIYRNNFWRYIYICHKLSLSLYSNNQKILELWHFFLIKKINRRKKKKEGNRHLIILHNNNNNNKVLKIREKILERSIKLHFNDNHDLIMRRYTTLIDISRSFGFKSLLG